MPNRDGKIGISLLKGSECEKYWAFLFIEGVNVATLEFSLHKGVNVDTLVFSLLKGSEFINIWGFTFIKGVNVGKI